MDLMCKEIQKNFACRIYNTEFQTRYDDWDTEALHISEEIMEMNRELQDSYRCKDREQIRANVKKWNKTLDKFQRKRMKRLAENPDSWTVKKVGKNRWRITEVV